MNEYPRNLPTEKISITVANEIVGDELDQLVRRSKLGLGREKLPNNRTRVSVASAFRLIGKIDITREDISIVRARLIEVLENIGYNIEAIEPAEKRDSIPAPDHHTAPDKCIPLD